jgi:hypothetical protein
MTSWTTPSFGTWVAGSAGDLTGDVSTRLSLNSPAVFATVRKWASGIGRVTSWARSVLALRGNV